MNEIPSSGPEREAYIISVIQGVKREGEMVVNVEARFREKSWGWGRTDIPLWNWKEYDYRLYEPEVVHYANGSGDGVGIFRESIARCRQDGLYSPPTHYVKRTTGGGRTLSLIHI